MDSFVINHNHLCQLITVRRNAPISNATTLRALFIVNVPRRQFIEFVHDPVFVSHNPLESNTAIQVAARGDLPCLARPRDSATDLLNELATVIVVRHNQQIGFCEIYTRSQNLSR